MRSWCSWPNGSLPTRRSATSSSSTRSPSRPPARSSAGSWYPTVRLRLDRLIEKVKLIDEQSGADPFELRLRGLYAEARLDDATFRELLRAYREEERK